jgi:hypothetical protein
MTCSFAEDGTFRLASRIEDGEEQANVGLVVQAESNFYRPLVERFGHRDGIIAVRKRGTGTETRYKFARIAADPVDLSPVNETFDALLEQLADPAEISRILDTLPPYWHFSRRSLWAR